MQPRSTSTVTFEAAADSPELQALKTKAEQDPRAAFDLGLRYYRGDGVERNTYQALRWMREAAEHGHTAAQLALGRFYLSGVEEMGPDPAEAESWLALAAEKGDSEAQKLLVQAQQAKKDEIEYQRWVSNQRLYWLGYWASGYHYYSYWRQGAWYFY